MIKQELSLRQQQKLSPLQIQTIKLIELPVQELEQRIRKELEENPVLDDDPPEKGEEDDGTDIEDAPRDVSLSEINTDDPIPSYNLHINNYGKDERPEYNTFSVKQSFVQSLREQLGFRDITDHEKAVAYFIIGSLDDDGYLRRDIDNLVDDLAFRANIETDAAEVGKIIAMIQEFDPPGVGARDLRECLLIQLRGLRQSQDVEDAISIVDGYFQEFSNRHFQKIMGKLGLDEKRMKAAMARIVRLNPSPGGQIDDSYADHAQQVVPDFVLELQDGELKLSMPRFSIP